MAVGALESVLPAKIKKFAHIHSGGAPKTSWVWSYFDYDAQSNSSLCCANSAQLLSYLAKIRVYFISTCTAQRSKRRIWQCQGIGTCEESERECRSTSTSTYYRRSCRQEEKKRLDKCPNNRWKQIRTCSPTGGYFCIPHVVIKYGSFVSLVECLDHKAKTHKPLAKEIDILSSQLDVALQKLFKERSRIAFCANLWSRAGYIASYSGVMANWRVIIMGDCGKHPKNCNWWAKHTYRKWLPVLLQSVETTLKPLCVFPGSYFVEDNL